MKRSVLILALAALSAGAGERTDCRVRTFVEPTRVVAESGLTNGLLSAGGWILYDFDRERAGTVRIACGRGGAKVIRARVCFGESVAEALSELGERGSCNDHAIRDDVIALPWFGAREVGETGFRFVRLVNVGNAPFELSSVLAVETLRPMERRGAFRSSDPRLNAIFDTAVRTVHLCCQDYLWDGIKRDRLVWVGDMHPETKAILPVFGAASVLPESLDYMAETTPPDRWMNGHHATYTLWWIRNLAEWYRYTGDLAFLQAKADYLRKTFDHVRSAMKDGLWCGDNFLDWPTKHNDAAATAGTQALALLAARDMAFLAHALKDGRLGAQASALADELAKLRPDPHGSKSAAALLALSGLRDPKEIFADVLGANGHAGVSTFYGYYMLEAMSAAGESQRALDTVRDYWGAMLDMGATSFWEDFNVAWTNNAFRIDELPVAGKRDVHGDYGDFCYRGFRHSLCHGWSAGPVAWCYRHVLGIRPQGVGSRAFQVQPFLGDLDWAEGEYALPQGGVLKVRVTKNADGTLKTDVTAPKGVSVLK